MKLKDLYTGKIYADKDVLATAPVLKGEYGPIEYFHLDKYVNDDALEKEYESRGLIPADLLRLARTVEKSHEHDFIATHWKDADDKWCFAAFDGWGGEPSVNVNRFGNVWDDGWWFAGLRRNFVP